MCKQFNDLPLAEIQKLLDSPTHEHRLAAVIVLVNAYKRADQTGRREIYDFYMTNVRHGTINNWDIVDSSAGYIAGDYLFDKPRDVLFELAASSYLWQRRVSIISTQGFINRGDPTATLELAEVLLNDRHDLIHKAVGWMLREVGKRIDRNILLNFLDDHAYEMPRTMLRYAIEHLPEQQRRHYMNK